MDDLFAEITIDAVLSAARGMREEERNRVPVFDERMRMVVLVHFSLLHHGSHDFHESWCVCTTVLKANAMICIEE